MPVDLKKIDLHSVKTFGAVIADAMAPAGGQSPFGGGAKSGAGRAG